MKKSIIIPAFLFLLIAFSFQGWAGNKTVSFKTNAVCDMCKDKITTALQSADGVEKLQFDMTTKVVRIKYDDAKTNEAALALLINQAGYDAGEHKADASAQKALPSCCKPGQQCDH